MIQGEHTRSVENLLKSNPEWVAPRLWIDEFYNVLCTLQRAGKMNATEALEIIQDARQMILESHEISPERILSVSRQSGCSGYDSQYIGLAEELALPLFTYDKQILIGAPQIASRPR